MARPERNTVDYFPYIVDEGEKMFYIEETYGNDGFSTFIKILTFLAKTDYHYLDLSKPTTQMFLSAKCKVSRETLNSIITDLVELGKFNKSLWIENKIIWCQDFIDSIQDAYKKRNNECITFEGLLILLNSLGVRKLSLDTTKGYVKPQSIVDYSIEDKKKVDVVKPATFFTLQDFEDFDLENGTFMQIACRDSKKSIEDVILYKSKFIEYQKGMGTTFWKNEKDAKLHFVNWLKKQPSSGMTINGISVPIGTNSFNH